MHLILIAILALEAFFLTKEVNHYDPRFKPRYTGVEAEFGPLVSEYKGLAKTRGIVFTKPITMGFNNVMKDGQTIGLTYYGTGFREIDIDKKYWENASDLTRKALLFHELTHGYCGRDHDYGPGELDKYPDAVLNKIFKAVYSLPFWSARPGYLYDGCPSSLMHPSIISDYCTETHYKHYVDEMFERCKLW